MAAKFKYEVRGIRNPFAQIVVSTMNITMESCDKRNILVITGKVRNLTGLREYVDRANVMWEAACECRFRFPGRPVEFEVCTYSQEIGHLEVPPYFQFRCGAVRYRINIPKESECIEQLRKDFGSFYVWDDIGKILDEWVFDKNYAVSLKPQTRKKQESEEEKIMITQETDLFVIAAGSIWSVDTGHNYGGFPETGGKSYVFAYKLCDYKLGVLEFEWQNENEILVTEYSRDEYDFVNVECLQFCKMERIKSAWLMKLEKMYRDGRSNLPDAVFDNIMRTLKISEERLQEMCGGAAECELHYNSYGVDSDKSSAITENYPAAKTILSQEKVRNGDKLDEIVRSWQGKSVVSLKLDGVAVRLHYKGRNFVRAESKGKARDVTALMKHIRGIPMPIYHGLPFTEDWFKDKEWFVTGELVAINERRSVAAGYLLRKDADSEETKEIAEGLKFVVYDSNIFKFPSKIRQVSPIHLYSQMLTMLQTEARFEVVNAVEFKGSEQITSGEIFEELGLPEEVDTDGLVVRINDIKKYSECGETQHHPKGSVAFKFEDEWKRVKPDVIYGRTGCNNVVKLIAEFPPLDFNGKIVKSAVWQPKGAFNLKLNYDRKLWENKRAEKIFVTVRKSENYWQSEEVPFEEHFDVSEIEVCLRGCVIPQWRLIGNGLNKN